MLYSSALPFPLNYMVRTSMQTNVRRQLTDINFVNATNVYVAANEITGALSALLANKQFMFGDRPSTLDAAMFGWLAVAYYAPMPRSELRQAIDAHKTLVFFMNRILSTYYATTPTLRRQHSSLSLSLSLSSSVVGVASSKPIGHLLCRRHLSLHVEKSLEPVRTDAFASAWDVVVPLTVQTQQT